MEQSVLKSVAKLAWLTVEGNAKKPSRIKDYYQLYLASKKQGKRSSSLDDTR